MAVDTRSLQQILTFLIAFGLFIVPSLAVREAKCEEITIPMCRGIGYNMTYMPNRFNHESQEEAGMEVHQFWPLVEIKCSTDLKFFLCSMYTPICVTNYHKPLPACRSVCERAKSGCAPLMRQYGFAWPERMRCEDLPVFGGDQLCMDFNTSETSTTQPTGILPPTKPTKPGVKHSGGYNTVQPNNAGTCCSCRAPMIPIPESSSDYNQVMTGGVPNCGTPCHGAFFSDDEKTFASFWIGLWSILCCISTFITILTYCIDSERFKYPERPIIFLSGCYLLVSVGYIIRLIAGHEAIACNGATVRYDTTGPAMCTIVFLLIYFFGMASSLWWVILSFTWFLAAGLKWGSEAIASYSQFFHLAVWLIPSIKTIAVLATSSIDGDPIIGICYVGNQNMDNLRGFVLIPLIVYLLIGSFFLLAGFVSLFRIRHVIKQGGTKTDKLEKLMIRIGVFTVLYTVPATIVVACYFYEQHSHEQWNTSYNCPCGPDQIKPDYSVFMLKYFMCLVVGITSGFWIWSSKTLDSWKRFYERLCGHESRPRISGPINNKALSFAHV